MKFEDKYNSLKEWGTCPNREDVFKGWEKLSCHVCNEPTSFILIGWQARVCSDECYERLTQGSFHEEERTKRRITKELS